MHWPRVCPFALSVPPSAWDPLPPAGDLCPVPLLFWFCGLHPEPGTARTPGPLWRSSVEICLLLAWEMGSPARRARPEAKAFLLRGRGSRWRDQQSRERGEKGTELAARNCSWSASTLSPVEPSRPGNPQWTSPADSAATGDAGPDVRPSMVTFRPKRPLRRCAGAVCR